MVEAIGLWSHKVSCACQEAFFVVVVVVVVTALSIDSSQAVLDDF